MGLLFSCAPGSTQFTADNAVASELTGLRSLLSGIDASLGLIEDGKQNTKVLARSVDGGSDDSLSGKLPSDVYSEYGGSGKVRVPSTNYFQDFYGNEGVEAYFTMEPDGDYYRIKLYTYPSVNFEIKYNYEEYLVGSGSNGTTDTWTYMNDAHISYRFSKYKTYFSDGSIADRELTFTSEDTGPAEYYNSTTLVNAVSDDILGSGEYNYPFSIPELVHSAANSGDWSSRTESIVDIRGIYDLNSVEYYTENAGISSGVTYVSTDRVWLWGTESKNVTRFRGNSSTGVSKERSLTTIGSIGSVWYTQTNAVDIKLQAKRVVYDKVEKLWYLNPGSADDGNVFYHQNLHLIETAENSNQYTGYVEDFWGSGTFGNRYNISLSKKADGSYKYKRSGWSSAFRSVKEDLELTLTKSKDIDVVFVSIPVGSGRFYGLYENGAFTGVYTAANGQDYSVSVDSVGISLNGTLYKYNEL